MTGTYRSEATGSSIYTSKHTILMIVTSKLRKEIGLVHPSQGYMKNAHGFYNRMYQKKNLRRRKKIFRPTERLYDVNQNKFYKTHFDSQRKESGRKLFTV